MRGPHRVVSVLDAHGARVFVWWVNVGEPDQDFSRLCGAWDMGLAREDVEPLIGGRLVLATSDAERAMAANGITPSRRFDPNATLDRVQAEAHRLHALWVQENGTRTKSKQLPEPDFPRLPAEIDIDDPPAWTLNDPSEDHLDRVLRLAHWTAGLCRHWDALEDLRLARPWMSSVDGNTRRCLPVVVA